MITDLRQSDRGIETHLETVITLICESLANGQSVCFSPMGISMLPMLRQGIDSVVLSPIPGKLKKYDLPLYQRENGKYVLHRVIRAGETYTLMGDNQFQEEPGIRQEQLLALVTGFYRGENYHSVNEPAYRLYCRLWHYSRPLRRFWCRGVNFLRRKFR